MSSGHHEEAATIAAAEQAMQIAFLQDFYQTVRDKCFDKCVTKPSSSLSSSEQQCLARCCDRYAEATQIVTKAVLDMSGLE
ncbi:mitochondrial import inner membrane translocase subunit Tim13 [Chlorella sorokiniana]|jgi:import inner membrane translocase subunit TIM13|uniref:Mitochondrial import inner membrane translocase subunit n=1 Tax=Chlorella sorokiniana TaxID=3076 RepID=A0A2P6TMR2_CHLSO|nr:mitochondrial import inner membrane translocase subunit Tim13 [Chlorella sorokiniana]|eukprot:PRW45628.1 mitochondrial import inner membrane translocase subunit Tim13 [Chlorella sorokiniana]